MKFTAHSTVRTPLRMNTSLCIGAEDLGRKEKGFKQDQHGFPDNLRAEAISRSNSLFPQMFAKEEIGLKQNKANKNKTSFSFT